MLKVMNASKKMGGFSLEDVNFEIPKGFIMGLIGESGAGKTTLLKTITGLKILDSGGILVDEKSIEEDEIAYKNSIGFVYDELNYPSHLKVMDFKNTLKTFYKDFDEEKFRNLLVKFSLKEDMKIGDLSKGQKVKLMVANALSHNAKLILLDEPTAGLDPLARKEILSLLQEEIENGEKSVIFSTHITTDLDGIADYITFISKGRVVFSWDMETLKERFRVIRGTKESLEKLNVEFINMINKPYYSEGLFIKGNEEIENSFIASLEDIMGYYIRGNENE